MVKIEQYCGINMTNHQISQINKFTHKHHKCSKDNHIEFIIRPEAIGSLTYIRCIICGKTKDITDVNLW